MKEFGLYLHIPFCARKCHYCDFLSMSADASLKGEYVKMLQREIQSAPEYSAGVVTSIFFGGGTPSLLTPLQIEGLMQVLRNRFQIADYAEISIEVNPGTVDRDKIRSYRMAGINRISMGLQSTKNEELKMLGRIHSFEQFLKNYDLMREEGFRNINVDLLLAIPGQHKKGMLEGLTKIISLKPEHISVYSLILEEGTKFYEIQDSLIFPSEESERELYWAVDALLSESGYHPYEISNYALPGKECRHNLRYWSDGDYLGMGIGAASYWEGVRFRNSSDIGLYIRQENPLSLREIEQVRDEQKHLEEYLFLGLRKREGIFIPALNSAFQNPLQRVYSKEMAKFLGEGYLETKGDYLRLTKKGIDFSNSVFAELIR